MHMPFCSNCGSQVPDGKNFCPQCGAAQAAQQNAGDFSTKVTDKFNEINNTTDYSSSYRPEDIAANKVMAVFAYIGILFLIPLLAAKESPFARYHANQGLVLFLFEIAAGIVMSILGWIPVLGTIINIVLWLVIVALCIIGKINAVNGKCKDLPVIGKFRLIK